MKEVGLILLPIVVTILFVMVSFKGARETTVVDEINLMQQQSQPSNFNLQGSSTINSMTSPQQGVQEQSKGVPMSGDSGDDDTCSCPDALSTNPCSVEGGTVLGGVDFVQYFTTFKLSDGSYNESNIGQAGLPEFNSTYEGFVYLFLSQDNKDLFDADPEAFIPQWGGYCSWGIGHETCPPYPWAADCLGPSGNWAHWTIINEKLYFFLFETAKENFMSDPDTCIEYGDSRWSSWFSDAYTQMSTHCFSNDPTAVSLH